MLRKLSTNVFGLLPSHGFLVWRWRAILAASALVVLRVAIVVKAEQPPHPVVQAWENRESTTKSLRCEWARKQVVPKGLFSVASKFDRKNKNPPLVPPKDTVLAGTAKLLVDGSAKFRYELLAPQYTFETGSIENRLYSTVTDGEEQLALFDNRQAKLDPTVGPRGYRYNESAFHESTSIAIRPVLILYRPSLATLAGYYDIKNYSEVGHVQLDGKRALVLQYLHAPRKTILYLDESHEFVPLRAEEWTQDKLCGQVDFKYAYPGEHDWQLTGWTISMHSQEGMLLEQITAQVTAIALNEKFSPEQFTLAFPVGTLVRDIKDNDNMYILKEGGIKRPVTDKELRAEVPYDKLLESDPDEALHNRPSGRGSTPKLFVAGNIAVVVALLVLLYFRRRRS